MGKWGVAVGRGSAAADPRWKRIKEMLLVLIGRCSLFFFLYLAGNRFLVNAEIDPVILGLFPGSQSIKLVLFNQGS